MYRTNVLVLREGIILQNSQQNQTPLRKIFFKKGICARKANLCLGQMPGNQMDFPNALDC